MPKKQTAINLIFIHKNECSFSDRLFIFTSLPIQNEQSEHNLFPDVLKLQVLSCHKIIIFAAYKN